MMANAALAAAAQRAEKMATRGALKTSDRLRMALRRAPATKPSWTDIVIQAVRLSPVRASCGAIAAPVNHSDIASNSASESRMRTRVRGDIRRHFNTLSQRRHGGAKEFGLRTNGGLRRA